MHLCVCVVSVCFFGSKVECKVLPAEGEGHKEHICLCYCVLFNGIRRRPYLVEYTGSLLTSEVKLPRAWLVLGWGTAWEHLQVLSAFSLFGAAARKGQAVEGSRGRGQGHATSYVHVLCGPPAVARHRCVQRKAGTCAQSRKQRAVFADGHTW